VIANKAQLLSQFDAEVRRDIVAEPGIRVERTARVVRIAGLWNCILYAELSAESADIKPAAIAFWYSKAIS
jgi:hypothetical protein